AWLMLRAKPPAGFRRSVAGVGLAAMIAYLGLLSLAMWQVDKPRKLLTFVTPDRLGMTYGYLPTWASEWYYLDMDVLLQDAIDQRQHKADRLSAIQPPVPLTGDVVVVQVESLDWRLLNHRHDGREVTPRLNRLAEEAMLFNVTAFHENGSGDTDFVMLCAVPPSPSLMTYML